jgi:hypothetical protein
LLGASVGIGAGACVVAEASEYDDVEGVVGGAVTAAIESVTMGAAAARRDGSGSAKVCERSLGT